MRIVLHLTLILQNLLQVYHLINDLYCVSWGLNSTQSKNLSPHELHHFISATTPATSFPV